MNSCKFCGIHVEDARRLYCECCFWMVSAVMMAPQLCGNCHCPLDEKREEVYELENEQGETKEFCSVCHALVEAICFSPYFTALIWAEEVRKSHKECE